LGMAISGKNERNFAKYSTASPESPDSWGMRQNP
jgi:hypothetical protein